MKMTDVVRRLLGRGDDEQDELYRCIHCGDEFERNYQECPSCGRPYVVELED
jgi:rubrerythrin